MEEPSGDLVRQASAGDPDLTEYPRTRFRRGEGMSGKALAEKRAISIHRPAEDPRYLLKEWARAKGINAAAAIRNRSVTGRRQTGRVLASARGTVRVMFVLYAEVPGMASAIDAQ
mgnify:CR=1 FL=1